jgi:ATP-dependent Clp protease ATP-binding subunit ClpX
MQKPQHLAPCYRKGVLAMNHAHEASTLFFPRPKMMKGFLDQRVWGQDWAKRRLCSNIYHHYMAQERRRADDVDHRIRFHGLLIGPTGSGKTLMMKSITDFLGVPVGITSAAGLVEAGYRGNSVENVIRSVVDAANRDPRRAETGIAFVDEIDKIRRCSLTDRDVSGEGVQNALLTMMDGRLSDGIDGNNFPTVDTSRMLFVMAGAFVGLEEIVSKRLQLHAKRFGFSEALANRQVAVEPSTDLLDHVTPEDLIEFGMIPEFVGRFSWIANLNRLTDDDIFAMLKSNLQHTALAMQKRQAMEHGVELTITDEALKYLTRKAVEKNTGIRGVDSAIRQVTEDLMFEIPELADAGITEIQVDLDCVLGQGAPKLTKGTSDQARHDIDRRRRAAQWLGSEGVCAKQQAKEARLLAEERRKVIRKAQKLEEHRKKLSKELTHAESIDDLIEFDLVAEETPEYPKIAPESEKPPVRRGRKKSEEQSSNQDNPESSSPNSKPKKCPRCRTNLIQADGTCQQCDLPF